MDHHVANAIEPFYPQLGLRIQTERIKKAISQEQLGAKLSPRMTRASIGNIETGNQRVLAHTLVQLARALDVKPGDLLPVEQESAPQADAIERELGEKLHLPPQQIKQLTKQIGIKIAKSDERRKA
jgi:transcriptional regulator with XRE-family HTH domain